MRNPCLTCGACCAYFRNSFYWAEAGDATPGGIPPEYTEKLTPFLRVMKGTNQPQPRCVGLEGEIGRAVFCSLHALRPSPCRDFPASWIDGEPNARCDQARAAHGMPPLTPADYDDPDETPPDNTPAPFPELAPAA